MGLEGGEPMSSLEVDRVLSARARTGASRTCARPPRSPRAHGRAERQDGDDRARLGASSSSRPRRRGSTACSRRWASSGASRSMCLAMNTTSSRRASARVDVEPQPEGRQGRRRTHLLSPAMAAAAAVAGRLSDVRDFPPLGDGDGLPNPGSRPRGDAPARVRARLRRAGRHGDGRAAVEGRGHLAGRAVPRRAVRGADAAKSAPSRASRGRAAAGRGGAAGCRRHDADGRRRAARHPEHRHGHDHPEGVPQDDQGSASRPSPSCATTTPTRSPSSARTRRRHRRLCAQPAGLRGRRDQDPDRGRQLRLRLVGEHAPWSINDMGIRSIVSTSSRPLQQLFNNGMLPTSCRATRSRGAALSPRGRERAET